MIKEVVLDLERKLIIKLLEENDLELDKLIDKTFYLEEDSEIIGTISCYKNIIKCVALKKGYTGSGYFEKLVSEMINHIYQKGITNIMVFTKPIYEMQFKSMGFKEIVKTDNVITLEYGLSNIDKVLKSYKNKIESYFNIELEKSNIGAVVINGNPVTLGHEYLIETASKNHSFVIVFLLEEDLSYFTYKERMTLAYLAFLPYRNVLVVPSTDYIVSSLTFPGYFLKEESKKNKEWAKVDALIFKNYFMKELNIKARFVGTEEKGYMKVYNDTLQEVLQDKLVIVDRIKNNDKVISASAIRKLIEEEKIDEAMESIPNGCKAVFYGIVKSKNG